MDVHTYTIVPDGAGSFDIQISFAHEAGTSFVHGFKSREAAVTWVHAREGADARIVHK